MCRWSKVRIKRKFKVKDNSERYELIGERALDLTSPFDEHAILSESIDYIQATLESTFGLQGVQVRYIGSEFIIDAINR